MEGWMKIRRSPERLSGGDKNGDLISIHLAKEERIDRKGGIER